MYPKQFTVNVKDTKIESLFEDLKEEFEINLVQDKDDS
jgi:hypothetical protein